VPFMQITSRLLDAAETMDKSTRTTMYASNVGVTLVLSDRQIRAVAALVISAGWRGYQGRRKAALMHKQRCTHS
jgi:hypothetical protein